MKENTPTELHCIEDFLPMTPTWEKAEAYKLNEPCSHNTATKTTFPYMTFMLMMVAQAQTLTDLNLQE